MSNSQTEKINLGFKRLFRALDTASNPKIHESIFVKHYLPMFASGIIDWERWVDEVATSVYHEVDVVDNQGNTLYTVPPLALRIKSSESKRSHDSNMARMRKKTMDPKDSWNAAGLLADPNSMDDKGAAVYRKGKPTLMDSPEDNLRRWATIFKRYNIDIVEVRAHFNDQRNEHISKWTGRSKEELDKLKGNIVKSDKSSQSDDDIDNFIFGD